MKELALRFLRLFSQIPEVGDDYNLIAIQRDVLADRFAIMLETPKMIREFITPVTKESLMMFQDLLHSYSSTAASIHTALMRESINSGVTISVANSSKHETTFLAECQSNEIKYESGKLMIGDYSFDTTPVDDIFYKDLSKYSDGKNTVLVTHCYSKDPIINDINYVLVHDLKCHGVSLISSCGNEDTSLTYYNGKFMISAKFHYSIAEGSCEGADAKVTDNSVVTGWFESDKLKSSWKSLLGDVHNMVASDYDYLSRIKIKLGASIRIRFKESNSDSMPGFFPYVRFSILTEMSSDTYENLTKSGFFNNWVLLNDICGKHYIHRFTEAYLGVEIVD